MRGLHEHTRMPIICSADVLALAKDGKNAFRHLEVGVPAALSIRVESVKILPIRVEPLKVERSGSVSHAIEQRVCSLDPTPGLLCQMGYTDACPHYHEIV